MTNTDENQQLIQTPSVPTDEFDMFLRLLPSAKMVLGDTQTKILQFCLTPRNTKEVTDLTKIHYQTVRQHMSALTDLNLVIRSGSRGRVGYMYQTNVQELNRYLVASRLGRQLLDSEALNVLASNHEPNMLDHFRELPTPKESMRIKIGKITTTVWKLLVSSGQTNTRYSIAWKGAAAAILHLWYRNYQYSHNNVSVVDLPGPSEDEVLQFLKEVHKDMLDYASVLKDLIDNKYLFELHPDRDNWRILGDFPVRYAQDYSTVFTQTWNEGRFGTIGIRRTINDDFEQAYTWESARYVEEYIRLQKEGNL